MKRLPAGVAFKKEESARSSLCGHEACGVLDCRMTIETKPHSRKLRIAFVLDTFTPSRGGERYFAWLAHELSRQGHDVHVYAMKIEEDPEAGYKTHPVPAWRFPKSLRLLSFFVNTRRIIRPGDFDIVHGVGGTAAMNVFNPHGGVEQAYLVQEFCSMTPWAYRVFRVLRRVLSLQHHLLLWIQRKQYLSGRVKRVIAISQMVRKDILKRYGSLKEKVVVVFNAVDLDRFHPKHRMLYREPARTSLGVSPETVVMLFVGNNYRLKGLEPLLSAMSLLRQRFPGQPMRLLVAGRSRAGRYQRQARRLKIADQVLFLGPVQEMEKYYAASDIYVHPTFYDSCSLTVLEALASGLPVVTSRFNGAADAIHSDEGGKIVTDPWNVAELAEALAYYFDEGRRTRARTVTRQWMEKFPPRRNLEETLNVYEDVVREEARSRQGQGSYYNKK